MSIVSDSKNVKEQYADSKNLSVRIALHQKYSTNPVSFSDWMFGHYQFFPGCRILELGCGTGGYWEGKIEELPEGTKLVLSDYSEGMVKEMYGKFGNHENVSIRQIDIQSIPYDDNSFDFVIARHMLYHVPDLSKGLSEVRRVLKRGGILYTSTNSDKGMRAYLHDEMHRFNPALDAFLPNCYSFTLENGEAILKPFFRCVDLHQLHDSLRITRTQDLIDWIDSTISFASYTKIDLDGLYDYFEAIRIQNNGTIEIPKLTGFFVCVK